MSDLTYDVSDGSSNSAQSPDFDSGDCLTVDLDNEVADRTATSAGIEAATGTDVLALAFMFTGDSGPIQRNVTMHGISTLALLGDAEGSDVAFSGDLASVGLVTLRFDGSDLASDVFDGSGVGSGTSLDLRGGDGSDVLTGGSGDDTIQGGVGNDVLTGGLGIDQVFGGDGDDTVVGSLDAIEDDYDGGAGIDTIRYATAVASVTVDLSGGGLPFGIASGAEIGADRLYEIENVQGGSGDDTLSGDVGSNVFFASAGDDTIDGRGGLDTYDASAVATGVTIDLAQGFARGFAIGEDALVSIERAQGGFGDDLLFGDAGPNLLSGGGGQDGLAGGAGDDVLIGGVGDDVLVGGEGFDVARFSGPRVDYSIDLELQTVTHDEGDEGVDSFEGIERLSFGDGVHFDILLPVPVSDTFASGPSGSGIFDVLANDTDAAGAPLESEDIFALKIVQMPQNGLAYVLDDLRVVYIADEGFTGRDSFDYLVNTGQGADTARVEAVVSGPGSPAESGFVTGGEAGESLVGTARNNVMFAAGGNDDLVALLGEDVLHGGVGDDILVSVGGRNQLSGGLGADVFVLTHEPEGVNDFDTITDLTPNAGDTLLIAVEGLVNEDGLVDVNRIGLRAIGNGTGSLLVADLDDDPGTGDDGLEAVLARLEGVAAPGGAAMTRAEGSFAESGDEIDLLVSLLQNATWVV